MLRAEFLQRQLAQEQLSSDSCAENNEKTCEIGISSRRWRDRIDRERTERITMRFFSQETFFPYPWREAAIAFWRRYPNAYSKHVVSEDVAYRAVR